MTTCSDNHRLGRVSCGQTYGGEMQHCAARVSWSEHEDGYAHVTAELGTIELMWRKGKGTGEPAEPTSIGLHQDARGVWRRPAVGVAIDATLTRQQYDGDRPDLYGNLDMYL